MNIMKNKKVRILSLYGGGIRGVIQGRIMMHVESQIQRQTGNPNARLCDYFDLFVGTSTGGILALLYASGKFTAKEALDLYMHNGGEIFKRSILHRIKRFGGLRDEKHSHDVIERLMNDYFGESTMHDLFKPCLITTYDIERREAKFISSEDRENFYIKDIARATSAAPTYFEPKEVESLFGTRYALIDGGLFATNPVMCAYSEAEDSVFPQKSFPSTKDMLILSIGTGTEKESYLFKKFKNASIFKWIKPIINIMMSANSETMHYHVKRRFKRIGAIDNYLQIQPELINGDSALNNGKQGNLNALKSDGYAAIQANKHSLNNFVNKLID